MSSPKKDHSALVRAAFFLAVIVLSMWLGAHFAKPHLGESLWQDEAVTLSFHVSRGILDPFLNYVSPNSHIGFTSMLAVWLKLFPDGVTIPDLRLLPLLLFLAALPATFAAAFRLGGPSCAVLTVVLFALSPVSENFATQLRGYGPSWVFMSLALWCAIGVSDGKRRLPWLAGYWASSLGAIAILPTNFLFLSVVGGAVSARLLSRPRGTQVKPWPISVALMAIPALALLCAYSAVLGELVRYSSMIISPWSRRDLILDWLHGSMSGFIWLTPLAGAGVAVVSLRRSRNNPQTEGEVSLPEVSLLLVLGFLVVVAAMPSTPFPRTLVPFLPVWIAACSTLMVVGFRALFVPTRMWAASTALLVAAGLFWAGQGERPCRGATAAREGKDYDLCYQYFRDNYHPEQVLDVWAEQGPPAPTIVSDFEGFYSLRVLGAPARIFEYRTYQPEAGVRPIIVAHDAAGLQEMAVRIGEQPAAYGLIKDTGYFKVYGPLNAR